MHGIKGISFLHTVKKRVWKLNTWFIKFTGNFVIVPKVKETNKNAYLLYLASGKQVTSGSLSLVRTEPKY